MLVYMFGRLKTLLAHQLTVRVVQNHAVEIQQRADNWLEQKQSMVDTGDHGKAVDDKQQTILG